MKQQPPTSFYVVAFTALALSIAAFLLSLQNDDPGIAAAAGVIAALGWFVSAWLLRRSR